MRVTARQRPWPRAGLLEGGGLAAAHHRQHAVLRAGLPPDTGASMKCRPRERAAAASSRATSAEAVVWSTKMAPGCMPAKAPLVAQHHRAQVVVVAHAAEHEVGARGGGGRRGGVARARKLGAKGLGLGRGAVVDRDLVAGAGQVARHGEPITPRPRKATVRGGQGS
jgi:hypothetical protein